MESSVFEILGYTKDYFVNGKLIGYVVLEKPDREIYGYAGKQKETLDDSITMSNKRIIRKGTEVSTELLPICGRSRVKFFGARKKND